MFADFESGMVEEDAADGDPFSLAGLEPSFAENIRVRRLVIEGFSCICLDGWSECDVVVAMPLSVSVLETVLTIPAVACETGDPMTDGVCEEGGECSGFEEFLAGAIAAISREEIAGILELKVNCGGELTSSGCSALCFNVAPAEVNYFTT